MRDNLFEEDCYKSILNYAKNKRKESRIDGTPCENEERLLDAVNVLRRLKDRKLRKINRQKKGSAIIGAVATCAVTAGTFMATGGNIQAGVVPLVAGVAVTGATYLSDVLRSKRCSNDHNDEMYKLINEYVMNEFER